MDKWEGIREALKAVYGVNMVKQLSEYRGFVSYNGVPLAVIDISDEYVNVSLRSSLLPNDAGLIVGTIAVKYAVRLGENFEIRNGIVSMQDKTVSVMGTMKQDEVEAPEYAAILESQKANPN